MDQHIPSQAGDPQPHRADPLHGLRPVFPSTGTPDSITHCTDTGVWLEHSDRVVKEAHVVPAPGPEARIRDAGQDWLTKDAAMLEKRASHLHP